MTTRFDDDADDPELSPDDPLAVILRPPSDHLAPPPGSYDAIRRRATRRRVIRAAIGTAVTCAAALLVALPLDPGTSNGPPSPAPPSRPTPHDRPHDTPHPVSDAEPLGLHTSNGLPHPDGAPTYPDLRAHGNLPHRRAPAPEQPGGADRGTVGDADDGGGGSDAGGHRERDGNAAAVSGLWGMVVSVRRPPARPRSTRLQSAKSLVEVVVGAPAVDAAIVVQAAHVPVLIVDRLHQTQSVKAQDDLGVEQLVLSRPAQPRHDAIGAESHSPPIAGDVANLLQSPPRR
ncbi:hypothetical protein ABIE67_004913 [Streptomyces sp. V4I8]